LSGNVKLGLIWCLKPCLHRRKRFVSWVEIRFLVFAGE